MDCKTLLNSNKGTALITVILIIIIMSILGVSLVAVTLSGFKMSAFYSDGSRAYFAAEAAVEQVAASLDDRVSKRQEEALKKTSDYIRQMLQDNPNYIRNADGTIIGDVLSGEFRTKYLENFYEGLGTEFQNIDDDYLKGLLNTAFIDKDGNVFKDINPEQERMILESARYNSELHKLNIIAAGSYNDAKKRLSITFNLLPDPSEAPYRSIPKTVLSKRKTRPSIFQNALVAEKDMVKLGGSVNIVGDILLSGSDNNFRISDYVNRSDMYTGPQKIQVNSPYVVEDTGIFFYGDQDTEIISDGAVWYIAGKEMPMTKGIIYIDGNLNIGDGFNFNGIIMSSQNIIFSGEALITYDDTVDGLFNKDVNINGFFDLLVSEIPDEKIKGQRITSKNISIDEWKEIPVS